MIRKVFLQSLLVVALFHLASTAYANVNVQVIPYANGCKGAIIYNNSNHTLEITVSYIYEGQGGSYYSGREIPIVVQPRSNWTHHWLFQGPVDCSKPYSVRTNYTYVDKTVETERATEAQRRQAEIDRRQREQFLRDQQRRNDEAEAARKKRNEEFLRQREARLKKEREDHARAVERSRGQHWEGGCPPGQHCKPLHLPPPSNPNRDTSARVNVSCLGLVRTSERDLRECRQIEAKIRLENEQREASEAAAAAESRRRRDAEAQAAAADAARRRQLEVDSAQLSASPCAFADEQVRQVQPPPPSQNTAQSMQATAVYNQRVDWLSRVVQTCSDRDPCAGAEIFARRGPAQMQVSVNPAWQKGVAEWNAKAKADFQPTLARLRSACTAARNPSPTGQAPPASPSPYSAPSPVTQAAQTTDPCQNLRQAYESDKKNIVLAYQLKRCVKKNRQAIQVQ